jgi:hypothetical protein
MEFYNYEFVTLHIESGAGAMIPSTRSMYDAIADAQPMLYEHVPGQVAAQDIPITVIQNCLKQMEK